MEKQKNNDNSLISLLKEFIKELNALISEHIKLLKVEFAQNTHKFISATIALIFAIIFGHVGLIFLGLVAISLLDTVVDQRIALIIVTAVYFGMPLVLFVYAVNLFYSIFKQPKKSVEEIEKTGEEAKKWMNNLKK